MHRVIATLLRGSLLAVLPASPLHSQGVRGYVLDSLTGAVIGKGFVVILDDYGFELGRSLTSSTGESVTLNHLCAASGIAASCVLDTSSRNMLAQLVTASTRSGGK